MRLRPRVHARGQSIVEFSLVFPIILVLLVAVIEFGFALNALLATSFASRDAALEAAEAGNVSGADCVVLRQIEQDILVPADKTLITRVDIFWTDQTGTTVKASNVYQRTGSTTCTVNAVAITVPYTATSTGYLDTGRCTTVAGCGGAHTPSVDTIGVKITYDYHFKTPLNTLLGLLGPHTVSGASGMTMVQSNVMRMEPIL